MNRLVSCGAVATMVALAVGGATAAAEAPVAGPAPYLNAMSADGSHVVFTTAETIDPNDAEPGLYQDVYVWANGAAELVSQGPSASNEQMHAWGEFVSDDGSSVLFRTAERLVPEDADGGRDLYERAGGSTRLISTGPADTHSGPYSYYGFEDATADASHVFFTGSGFTAGEPPGIHLYERTGTTTRRVVTEQFPNFEFSADGTRVVFSTKEALVPEDTDAFRDVYERVNGAGTRLLSKGSLELQPKDVRVAAASGDAQHVLLSTAQRLEIADVDDSNDVYLRSGTTTRRVSTGVIGGNGGNNARALAVADDGSRVLFDTTERLVTDDLDDQNDVYEWTAEGTRLISTGPGAGNASSMEFVAASPDARRVVFHTAGSLTSDDGDTALDAYQRLDGVTTLLSGPSPGGVVARGARAVGFSRDLTHVFVGTSESFSAADTDGVTDVYERFGSSFDLTTTGPTDPQQSYVGIGLPCCTSKDGSGYVWSTLDNLTTDDTDDPASDPDASHDLYLRRAGQTYLVSE